MPALDLDKPYREQDPLDVDDARTAARRASRMRRDAEATLIDAIDERATKEGVYRETLAKRMVTEKVEHGASSAREFAYGDPKVKKALTEFRIAEGMVDAAKERLKTLEGERSMLKSLIDWSSTIANVLRQAGGIRHEPDDPRTDNRAGAEH